MSASPPILAVRDLSVEFGPVRALDRVDLDVREGEVHGLVGENGAGKSTLLSALSGLVSPTAGRILRRGEPVRLRGPADAVRLGVSMVHQELNLVEELSVADNVFLGREPTRFGLVDRRRVREGTRRALESLGARIDPRAKVARLSIAQKQMVEIARALSIDARVVVLDEPTAVLGRGEVGALLDVVRGLRDRGRAVVYVSHFLSEVLAICDVVTVLRDGRVVDTIAGERLETTTDSDLASRMVGRELGDRFPARAMPSDEVALEVDFEGARFEVRRGEVLGLAGLVGAGRTELAEAIAGLRPRPGEVRLDGRPVTAPGPREAVRRGIAYLSEDRRGRGLVLDLDVVANTTLVSLERYSGRLLLDRRAERAATLEHVRRLAIKLGRPSDPVRTLSGGNQQKVCFAKWLEIEPRVLVLDEPTRGVDVGAKTEIYRLIRDLSGTGLATVLVSSELPELLGLCHRIAVMRAGRIAAVLDGPTATEEDLVRHAAGVAA